VWLIPLVVFGLFWAEVDHLAAIVAVVVAGGYFFVIQRRVTTAITVLVVLILFNSALLPLLYKAGLSASVVQAASLWKEGIVAGSALALVRRQSWHRLDALDVAALAFLAVGTAYLLVPGLFVHGSGASLSLYDRALGWRSDVLYVAVFLIFRHLHLGRAVVDRIFRRVVVAVSVVAAIGIFEALFSSTWNHFAVKDLGVTTYRYLVLHEQPSAQFNLNDVRTFALLHGHPILRIGSVLFDYIAVGFVFAIGLGIAAEMLARGNAPRWVYGCVPLIGAGLLLTQTRSAIFAGIVAVAFALRRREGKRLGDRARFARVLAVLLIVSLPIVLATGLLQRIGSAPTSNALHQSRVSAALNVIKENPLGQGLATAGGGGGAIVLMQRTTFGTVPLISESQFLQVGTELGVLGLASYAAMVVLLLRHLLRRREIDRLSQAPAAMSSIAVGTFAGVLVTQAFVSVELAFVFWGLAGLAAGVADQEGVEGDGPDDDGHAAAVDRERRPAMNDTATIAPL
jgi:O-antigen ligase